MWDAENMFSNDQPLANAESDCIIDTGPKDSGKGHSLYLQAVVGAGASGTLAITLNASDARDMSSARKVAEYEIPAERVARGGVVLAALLPTGCRRYLQLKYAGATGGAVSAGLVFGSHTANLE